MKVYRTRFEFIERLAGETMEDPMRWIMLPLFVSVAIGAWVVFAAVDAVTFGIKAGKFLNEVGNG